MFPKMEEVTLSAVVGELANRTISFLINRWSKLMAPTEEMVDNLQHLLLRVGAIVEEAEGRHITNQAMVCQLSILRNKLYRGYYTLDTFRCKDSAQGYEVGHSFAVSRFNPAKRLCTCSSSREIVKDLTRVLKSLETSLQDVAEFIMLSGRYPRLARQPYSMYLLLDKCMFGRQMEMELLINFLLQSKDPGAEHHGVLPIVGPRKVGKSTLVEHACMDERVHRYFSRIVFLSGDHLRDEHMVSLRDSGVIKYNNQALVGGRVLIVVELDRDVNEALWQRLRSDSESLPPGSKFIITGTSEKIISFGTTLPLRLQFFNTEAFWYFFKARMFGSMDVIQYPKLASLAMDMANEVNRCFMCFNIIYEMLKSNIDPQVWSLALANCRHFKRRNPFVCDPLNQVDPWALARPILIPTTKRTSPGNILIVGMYQTTSIQSGVPVLAASTMDDTPPKMTVQDLMFGRVKPQEGKFAALAWKSHIPPHYDCVFKCELRMPLGVASRKKITHKIS